MEQTPEETTTPEATPPSLALADLVLVVNLIRAASERGAIKAEEMSTVGALYEKLVAFLQASGAISPAPSSAAPAEPPAQ